MRYVGDLNALQRALLDELQPGDVVLTMGAGDITRLGPRLLFRLRDSAS